MRRLTPPTLLLLVFALVASACSALGEAPAATVDGTEITTESIEDEMQTIQSNDDYREALEASYGSPTQGSAGEGAFDAAFVAQVLSLRVWYRMLEADLEERGVEITDEIQELAASRVEQQFSQIDPDPSDDTNPVLEAFPDAYVESLVHQRALVETINAEVIESIGDDPEAYYEDNPDDFAEICVSHLLVGVQGGRTPAEAKAGARDLYDRIQAGEDFEDLAATESDDAAAAAQRGELGCGSRLTLQFDPVFLDAAYALEPGEVSEPVETQFGAHLILVTSREIPDYDDVADLAQSVMQQARDIRINEYLVDVICGTPVDINPRYGTWTSEKCDGLAPQLPNVEPPDGPIEAPDEGLQFDL